MNLTVLAVSLYFTQIEGVTLNTPCNPTTCDFATPLVYHAPSDKRGPSSPQDDVKEQAVWALGNIAGDSPECRDIVLQLGALHPLLQLLKDSYKGEGTAS